MRRDLDEDLVDAGEIVGLLRDRRFATAHAALVNGYHFCADDHPTFGWMMERLDALAAFYDMLHGELVSKDGFIFLVGREDVFGSRQATREEMIVGFELAYFYLDATRFMNPEIGSIGFPEFSDKLVCDCGGDASYAQAFVPRQRRVRSLHRWRRQADEVVCKALRSLEHCGFVTLSEDADGNLLLRPRSSIARFVEVLRSCEDLDEDELRGSLQLLQSSGRVIVLHGAPGAPPRRPAGRPEDAGERNPDGEGSP